MIYKITLLPLPRGSGCDKNSLWFFQELSNLSEFRDIHHDLSINPTIIDCGVIIIPRFLLQHKQWVKIPFKSDSKQFLGLS